MLTVDFDQNIRMNKKSNKYSSEEEVVDGFGVQLRNKTNNRSANQIWKFTIDGFIVSEAREDHALTSLATIIPGDDETFVANGIRMNENNPLISFVAICPKCKSDSMFIYRQR